MRNPLPKSLVMAALLILVAFTGHAASTDSSRTLLAVDACGCCPATCGGGTFIGCYHHISMPPNAVTCVYQDANGNPFDCVSCLLKAPAQAALDAIFAPAPAVTTVAQ